MEPKINAGNPEIRGVAGQPNIEVTETQEQLRLKGKQRSSKVRQSIMLSSPKCTKKTSGKIGVLLFANAPLVAGTGVLGIAAARTLHTAFKASAKRSESPKFDMNQKCSATASQLLDSDRANVESAIQELYDANKADEKVIVLRDGRLQVLPQTKATKMEISEGLNIAKHVVFKMVAQGESTVPGRTDSILYFITRLEGREPTKTMIDANPDLKSDFSAISKFFAFKNQFKEREEWMDIFNSKEFSEAHDELEAKAPDRQIDLYTENESYTPAQFRQVKKDLEQNFDTAQNSIRELENSSSFGSTEFNDKMEKLNTFVKLQLSPVTEMMNDLSKELIKEKHPEFSGEEKQAVKDAFVYGRKEEIRKHFGIKD